MKTFKPLSWLPQKSSFGRRFFFGLTCATLLLTVLPLSSLTDSHAQTAQTSLQFTGGIITAIRGGPPVGTAITVSNLTDPDGLGTFGFRISYDPAILSVDDFDKNDTADLGFVTGGTFLLNNNRQALCGDGYIDKDLANPSVKYLYVSCSSYSNTDSAGPTGSGILALVKFRPGNTLATTTLAIDSSEIVTNSINSHLIPHTTGTINYQVAKCADIDPAIPNGTVNIFDILAVATKFGSNSQSAGWDPKYDIDGNDFVTIFDMLTAGREFGRNCTN